MHYSFAIKVIKGNISAKGKAYFLNYQGWLQIQAWKQDVKLSMDIELLRKTLHKERVLNLFKKQQNIDKRAAKTMK